MPLFVKSVACTFKQIPVFFLIVTLSYFSIRLNPPLSLVGANPLLNDRVTYSLFNSVTLIVCSPNLLKEYLNNWHKIVKKLQNRENVLEKVLDNLEKYMLNNDVDTMANAQILKKFLHDYPLIRAVGFLRKLKDISKQKGKNEDFAKNLILAKTHMEPQKKNILIKKLFKVYAYKVLNKLFDNLQNKREKIAEPIKKEIFQKLFKNLIKKYEQNYKDKKELEAKPKNIRTSFKSHLKKKVLPKRNNDNDKTKLVYNYILPSLVKYLYSPLLFLL